MTAATPTEPRAGRPGAATITACSRIIAGVEEEVRIVEAHAHQVEPITGKAAARERAIHARRRMLVERVEADGTTADPTAALALVQAAAAVLTHEDPEDPGARLAVVALDAAAKALLAAVPPEVEGRPGTG